jgi:hypothetical protein
MKILSKIFRENKNFDFITKCYLYFDYRNNINEIKRKNKIFGYLDFFLFTKFDPSFNKSDKKSVNMTIPQENKNFPNFEKEISEIRENIKKERIKKIKTLVNKYIQYFNVKQLIDLKNSQNNVQKFFAFLSKHIGTYKKSISELVEGQREVTQNKNFLLDDGDTVQEKLDRFENKIKEHMNIQGNTKINIFQQSIQKQVDKFKN